MVVIGVLGLAGPLAAPAHADGGEGWTSTRYGPLGPADRDMLVRIRLAGLWEIPAGQMARDRAASSVVKEVGATLASDHQQLDVEVRAAAAKLGVELPDRPNTEQQGWLTELSNRAGGAFDQAFADRLRSAHGNVFSAIAAVRSGTRNTAVRDFAQTAVNVVMKHMQLLEGTGLVNYSIMTPPPAPPISRVGFSDRGPIVVFFVWVVLAAAVVAGVVAVARVVRPR
jgi:predicted outer membrane protein